MTDDSEEEERRRRNMIIRGASSSTALTDNEQSTLTAFADRLDAGQQLNLRERKVAARLVGKVAAG